MILQDEMPAYPDKWIGNIHYLSINFIATYREYTRINLDSVTALSSHCYRAVEKRL